MPSRLLLFYFFSYKALQALKENGVIISHLILYKEEASLKMSFKAF